MILTESLLHYRRYLKRKNYSPHTIKNYLNRLQHFIVWLKVPVESAQAEDVKYYIDFLLEKHLRPATINAHIISIRGFYDYLKDEEGLQVINPVVRGIALRVANPLPRHLRDGDVAVLFNSITKARDLAIFLIMLRCGLRVEEVANLTLGAVDYRRDQIMIRNGKGGKDRVVYVSTDAATALAIYLRVRPETREKKIFLVEKGTYKGKPISVRGIQKRIEYYSRKSGIAVSCHQLRHTMATQLLNANVALVTLQALLGHTKIGTTMRYCKLANQKAQRDYHSAVSIVMAQSGLNISMNMLH